MTPLFTRIPRISTQLRTPTVIWLLTLTLLPMLDGCGRKHVVPPPPVHELGLSSSEVKSRLQSQYNEWRGVPYRNGGQSRKGLDCSAFVQLTYRQRFGVKVPRTTEHLSSYGRQVTKSLRPGDLVFFKTGWGDSHVGMYLDKRRFLHVSTIKGVAISKITDPYWYERYWQARRVFN